MVTSFFFCCWVLLRVFVGAVLFCCWVLSCLLLLLLSERVLSCLIHLLHLLVMHFLVSSISFSCAFFSFLVGCSLEVNLLQWKSFILSWGPTIIRIYICKSAVSLKSSKRNEPGLENLEILTHIPTHNHLPQSKTTSDSLSHFL